METNIDSLQAIFYGVLASAGFGLVAGVWRCGLVSGLACGVFTGLGMALLTVPFWLPLGNMLLSLP